MTLLSKEWAPTDQNVHQMPDRYLKHFSETRLCSATQTYFLGTHFASWPTTQRQGIPSSCHNKITQKTSYDVSHLTTFCLACVF